MNKWEEKNVFNDIERKNPCAQCRNCKIDESMRPYCCRRFEDTGYKIYFESHEMVMKFTCKLFNPIKFDPPIVFNPNEMGTTGLEVVNA